ASTHHYEVVRVAHHLEAAPGHQVVERVEIDVAQQRAHHSALWRAFLGCPFAVAVTDALLEERLDQRQQTAVRHLRADQGEKTCLGNGVEGSGHRLPITGISPTR